METLNYNATIEEGYLKLLINFDIETYLDIPPDRHPDNPSLIKSRYFENPNIKTVELDFFGVKIDITKNVLDGFKDNGFAKELSTELIEFAEEEYLNSEYE